MDPFSNQVPGEDLLPADVVSLLPNRDSEWRPPKRSVVGKIRRFRFVGAWIALVVLSASTIWSLSWLQPQPEVCLSLIGAAYEENLSLDHNISGWNSVKNFCQLDRTDANAETEYFRLSQPPITLRGDGQWNADWKQSREKTLVVFCSAHGAADHDGPYLLAENAAPGDDSSRVRISSLLDSLRQLSPEKKKLLILDATHFASNWRYGVLHNDFARAMVQLNEAITSIPNLVVICASDVDQLSWSCQRRHRTVFGHYAVEAIRGAAADIRQDGRIDAEDIFQYTRDEVSTWVHTHLQRVQHPLLLPLGDVGLARAAEIQIAPVNRNYQEPIPPAVIQVDAQQIATVWQDYHVLKERPQKPYVHSPALWRRYESAILRYEQLLQAGNLHASNRILEEINSLHQQLEWDQAQSIAADQGNLTIGHAITGTATDRELARSIVNQLWAAKDGQHASVWSQQTHGEFNASSIGPLRIEVLSLLYERAMSDPANSLAKSARLVDYVLDPIEPPPAEINFLKMLSLHLPEDALSGDHRQLVGSALRIRLLGEQATVSWKQNESSRSATIFPWIQKQILAADRERLLGEDLLFAGTNNRGRAAEHFEVARQQYQLAIQRSAMVQEALSLQTQLAQMLPHMKRWIIGSGDSVSALQKSRIDAFESLMDESHKLAAVLRDAGNHAGDDNRLTKQTAIVSTLYGEMESRFDDWWESQIAEFSTNSKHDIALALSIPLGTPETRIALLEKHSAQSGQHETGSTSDATIDAKKPVIVAGRSGVLEKGQMEGSLALAMIGKDLFDKVRDPETDSFEQLSHRIDVFDTEEHWWRSMHIAGHQIQSSLNNLTNAADAVALDTSTSQSHAANRPGMGQLAFFNQLLGFANDESTEPGINLVQRNRLRSKLFANLARRSIRARWYGKNNRPFYIEAAQRYLQTAASLWPENPGLDATHKQLASVGSLRLDIPSRLDLTTETRMPFQIGIRDSNGEAATSGLPVLWIADGSKFQVSRPVPGQRLIQRMTETTAASPESCLLENPLVTASNQIDSSPDSPFLLTSFGDSPELSDSIEPLEVVGFFRGQTLSEKISVHLHATADTLVVEHAKPATAKLAVKASRSLHGLYGTGSGALAIVLDASGSMGAPAGEPFGPSAKYFEATRAMKKVLRGLPDGIQISVWIFGQATGPQKTVRYAERTIRRVAGPVVWNSADQGQIESLLKNISYPNVEPWNQSPIVETLLAAKQDLVGKAGFKSVLLLTDGMDNRFENNVNRSSGETVASALRNAFDKSGIVLNIIGFKVESKEAAESRKQFQVVESFESPGKYVEVQDTGKLAAALSSVLQQRVRYWIDDYASQNRLADNGVPQTRKRIEAGRSDQGAQWYPDNLNAASYAMWTNVNPKPFNLFLERGDQLIVELARQGNRLECRRAPFLTDQFSNRPAKISAGWKVAAIENRIIDSNRLSMLVGMEKTPKLNASAISMVRPFDVWFELNQQGSDKKHDPVSWSINRKFPVPAWRINAANWPQRLRRNGKSVATSPNLHVWWSPDRPVTPAVRFERGRDYTMLKQLVGRKVDVAGEPVIVSDLQVENRFVEVRSGVTESRPCLVVQLKHATDQQYWVRPKGTDFEGYEGRSYQSTGKYTGIFWPVVEDEVDRLVTALEVVSLADLKRQTEAQGCAVKLDNIPTPRADDVAFPPLTGLLER